MAEKICFVSNKEPFEYTLSIVSGKWKLKIIYLLACTAPARYNFLKKNIDAITHKMLSTAEGAGIARYCFPKGISSGASKGGILSHSQRGKPDSDRYRHVRLGESTFTAPKAIKGDTRVKGNAAGGSFQKICLPFLFRFH